MPGSAVTVLRLMEWVLNICINQETLQSELLPCLPFTSKSGWKDLMNTMFSVKKCQGFQLFSFVKLCSRIRLENTVGAALAMMNMSDSLYEALSLNSHSICIYKFHFSGRAKKNAKHAGQIDFE